MKRKMYTLLAIGVLTLTSSMTAFAAPEVMPDGGIFDAEYYAQNNPDVVTVYGTDKELLYSHYVNCGRTEGRQGFQITPDMYTTSPVASQKTLELLATEGTEGVDFVYKNYLSGGKIPKVYRLNGRLNDAWGELALTRTDFPDGLIDLDGNGIDDRDPINSMGFVDLNVNGIDDRSTSNSNIPDLEENSIEREGIDTVFDSDYYFCKHGVVCSFLQNPKNCPTCAAEDAAWKNYMDSLRPLSEKVCFYKVGDKITLTNNSILTYQGNDVWIDENGKEHKASADFNSDGNVVGIMFWS